MTTFKEFDQLQQPLNEGLMWELVKIADPSGITSVPDLIEAFQNWWGERSSPWKLIWLILCIVAVLPVVKYAGKGLASSVKALKAGAASPKVIAAADASLVKVVDALIKNETTVAKALEKVNIPKEGVQGFFSSIKEFKNNPSIKGALEIGKKGAKGVGNVAKGIAKEIPGTLGAGYTARTVKGGVNIGTLGAQEINKQLGGKETDQPQTQPGEEVVTYTDPNTGKQIQTTKKALQDAGIAPLEMPQPVVPTFAGRALTPAQARALGTFATPYIPGAPGQRGRPGTVSPQNIPQGATQENPVGREGMPPQEYMRPDRFNNPPNFFNRPQTYNYGPQQQYNPYNQNQYGDQYGGQPNPMAMVSGLIGGGMSGSPAQGIIGLASGLMGLLPGLGGAGVNPMQMLPGLMGGV